VLLPLLSFLETTSKSEKERESKSSHRFRDHVMILGFNETGLEVAEFFRQTHTDVVVCDLDPVSNPPTLPSLFLLVCDVRVCHGPG
jgi:UDP-N-acetylmuramoylalanine-D-glutamate ligase